MNTKQLNVTDQPDRWVILKIGDLYKVFGSWIGGYTEGDSWKVNSGIAKVDQDEIHYYFTGHSGSCYKCHKQTYGITNSYGRSVLDQLLKLSEGKVEVLEEFDLSIINKL